MPDRIEERARFDLVRYANVWEDAEVARAALAPGPGKRMLSIASAGDNAFVLLAAGAEVVAADLSPAQLALVETCVPGRRSKTGGILPRVGRQSDALLLKCGRHLVS